MPGLDKLVLSSDVCRHFSLARPKSTHNWHQQAPPRPGKRTPKQHQAHAPLCRIRADYQRANLTHVSLVGNRFKYRLPEMLKKLAGLSGLNLSNHVFQFKKGFEGVFPLEETKGNDEGHPLVLSLLGNPQSFGIPEAVILIRVESLLASNTMLCNTVLDC